MKNDCSFIYRNISTGPPDCRFNLADQVGLVAANLPQAAARANEQIVLPRRGSNRLHWNYSPVRTVGSRLVPRHSDYDSLDVTG
jgi:hypothetical protein